MGFISAIGDGIAIGLALAEVNRRINTARTCVLEIANDTDHTLRVEDHHHAHGGFEVPPEVELGPRQVDVFGSQSKGGSFLTGTEGYVKYAIDELATTATVTWNNPFFGDNGCSGSAHGEKALAFEVTRICGAGERDAHMKYELRQIRDPRLVRADGYTWVRLEGYAYAPETAWDPDGASPFPHPVLDLHSWYSRGREDNWATTDPRHTGPLRDRIDPDYDHYRLEGYVISPDTRQPPDTVALHSWYSRGRGDNWATTDARHVTPLRHRIDPDYGHYRLEGYLFAPNRSKPAGTVPVHSWYSRERGDNFLTSDKRYVP